jgi:hypothetical protein
MDLAVEQLAKSMYEQDVAGARWAPRWAETTLSQRAEYRRLADFEARKMGVTEQSLCEDSDAPEPEPTDKQLGSYLRDIAEGREPKWCSRCNGYGSSLSESSARCTACGGTGLAS